MVVVLKFWKPKSVMRLDGDAPVEAAVPRHSGGELFLAWAPYLLLVVFVLLWGEADVKLRLNTWTHGLWPTWVPTAPRQLNRLMVPGLHNAITQMPPVTKQAAPYAALYEMNWLSASGTACLLATLVSALVLGVRPGKVVQTYVATFKQLSLAMVTIASMLGLAYLMNYSGMTSTLGLSLAATGGAFPFFSGVVGWLGVFLTGSDTSANALFGNLQVVTANSLHLNPATMAASNSAGGVMGKMISLTSLAVAVAATGMERSEEGKLFRFTVKHSVFLASVLGILATVYAYA